jgi:hypothetical protein
MEERLGVLERQVIELARSLDEVRLRLEAMERRGAVPRRAAAVSAPADLVEPVALDAPPDTELSGIFGLVGRACLVLGGAYSLRALTDAGTVPRAAGTLVGLAYAVAWLFVAYRPDRSRLRLAPVFNGATSVLIAFPILWEATVSFKLLSPSSAAAATALVTSLGLAVAWRRRLQPLAWIVTCGGMLAALLFMAGLGPSVPFAFYLAFLGVATLWMGYSIDWIWLRWPAALVVDLVVLTLAGSVTGPWQRDGAGAVMALQLVVFAGYLTSIAARTLWRSRDVIPFEVAQTLALLVVAFGGAAYVMSSTGSGASVLGLASLGFGAGSYGVAFAFVDWRRGHWKNFAFYTTLGLALVLAGTWLSLGEPARAVAWTALALGAALLGLRFGTPWLLPHGAAYLVASALASGLLVQISDAFLSSAGVPWAPVTWTSAVVLLGAAACCAVRAPAASAAWIPYARVARLTPVLVLLLGIGGFVVAGAVPVLAGGRPGTSADAAVVAGVRTLVLAAAALLLARLGGDGRLVDGRWLTYLVLALGGLKLLVSDFVAGRPATLVVSLAAYGVALIVAPKWARRAPAEERVLT